MKNQATDTAVKQPNMDSLLAFLNSAQTQTSLRNIRRGIERERVRVTPQEQLSERSHPTTLGSALLHPYITPDFAEAQLERVTCSLK